MGKTKSKASLQKVSKKSFGLFAIFNFIILGILLLGFLAWGLLELYAVHIYNSNPAENQAAIIIPFAEKYNLEKVYEYNGPVGIDNTTPWFMYIYQGDQSIDEIKKSIENYLEEKGYSIRSELIKDTNLCDPQTDLNCMLANGGEPYWSINGKSADGNTVQVSISNKTYLNFANNAGDKFGINKVPPGKSVTVIDFTSSK